MNLFEFRRFKLRDANDDDDDDLKGIIFSMKHANKFV